MIQCDPTSKNPGYANVGAHVLGQWSIIKGKMGKSDVQQNKKNCGAIAKAK